MPPMLDLFILIMFVLIIKDGTVATLSPALSTEASYRELFRGEQRTRSLSIVLMLTLATLDVLIVATAMPTILTQLGDVHLYSWVFSGYTLSNIAALPIFGALSMRWGTQRSMFLAVGIFVVASVVAALAPSMGILVLGRVIQGFGAGGLFALAYTIISRFIPSQLQPRAIALGSGVWGVSALTGPLLGGIILETLGWPWIFWINIPLCLIVVLLGLSALRGSERNNEAAPANVVSPLLLTASIGLMLSGLTSPMPLRLALFAAGIGAILLLVWAERRSSNPIIPSDMWHGGTLRSSLLVLVLSAVAFFGAETFLPLLLQSGRGLSAVEAGLLISISSIAWSGSTIGISRFDAIGPRTSVIAGLLIILAGIAGLQMMLWFGLPSMLAYLFWGLCGTGMGIMSPSAATLVIDQATGPQAGTITASGQLAQTLGTTIGTAVAGAAAAIGFAGQIQPGATHDAHLAPELVAVLERGVSYALLLAFCAGMLALWFSRNLPTRRVIKDEE